MQGEMCACKPDIFAASREAAEVPAKFRRPSSNQQHGRCTPAPFSGPGEECRRPVYAF